MDFNSFDSRGPSDEGRPLHLRHPANGKLLFDNDEDATIDNGKPCRVGVRGSEGRETQKAIRAATRTNEAAAKEGEEGGGLTPAEIEHQNLVRLTAPLITHFENINRNGSPAKVSDDVEWFLNLQLGRGKSSEISFAEQIVEFSMKRANFLGNASSAS